MLAIRVLMMTSSNGNIFRVTGPLCGEFTGPGEFPAQRPVTRSFDVFFDLRLNKRLSKQPWGWWFETPEWSLWRHHNVFVLTWFMIAASQALSKSKVMLQYCCNKAELYPEIIAANCTASVSITDMMTYSWSLSAMFPRNTLTKGPVSSKPLLYVPTLNSRAASAGVSNSKDIIFKFIENSSLGTHSRSTFKGMPFNLTNEKLTSIQVMAWCRQTTSYYLNQC